MPVRNLFQNGIFHGARGFKPTRQPGQAQLTNSLNRSVSGFCWIICHHSLRAILATLCPTLVYAGCATSAVQYCTTDRVYFTGTAVALAIQGAYGSIFFQRKVARLETAAATGEANLDLIG